MGQFQRTFLLLTVLLINLRLQDKAAQSMQNYRYDHGALHLETIQARPVFLGEEIRAS